MTKMLHIADTVPNKKIWIPPFIAALQEIGDVTIIEDGNTLSEEKRIELIRDNQIVLTGWNSVPVPVSIVRDRGKLEYICTKHTLSAD